MSFAIIETGGKQYKVSTSKILEIEKLNAKVGETVKFKNVLLLNGDAIFDLNIKSIYQNHSKKNFDLTFLSSEITSVKTVYASANLFLDM